MRTLNAEDEVKAMDVFTCDDLVVVKLAVPIQVFAMTSEQALEFAKTLTEAAHYLMMGSTDGKVH